MSIVAITPTPHAHNAALESQGFGAGNFTLTAYSATGAAYAALHAWDDAAFLAALQSLPGILLDVGDGEPVARINALLQSNSARWGDRAPELPTSGNAVAGTLYRYGDGELWYCIQTFNRSTFNQPPATYPALIRRMRRPGEVLEWKQPTDAFDAYKLVNPFTGQPDRALFNGQRWRVTQADGSGNNVWQPGVFGWALDP